MENHQHSYEVHEILTEMPNWMIRWGISVFFGIVILLLGLSWLLKYPDIIVAKVVISAEQAPAVLAARSSGSLEVFAADEEWVKQGQVLAYLQNAANYEDVMDLKQAIKENRSWRKLDEDWQLGILQGAFNDWLTSLKKYRNLGSIGQQNEQRKNLIARQIEEYKTAIRQQKRQIRLLEEEYQEAQNLLRRRYQPLLTSGSISRMEYERHVRKVKDKESEIEGAKTMINESNNRILLLQKESQELDFGQKNEKVYSKNEIEEARSALLSQLSLWEQQYLLVAPTEGQLSYTFFAKDNMFVKAEQEIARIIPEGSSEIFGAAFLPQSGVGKVLLGQEVFIQLDSYQKSEFGVLKGQIQQIADASANGMYKAYINLPNGLITTANKSLNFRHDMEGTGEIITQDIRLLERIFNELRVVFSQHP